MKIVWIGVHGEGVPAFQAVCECGHDVRALITLASTKAARRCGSADYRPLCSRFGVPVVEVHHINDSDSVRRLKEIGADLGVVLGWGQVLSVDALSTARLGMVGAHASMLPHNRGSAPVNWAILRGEQETGNTLMWLNPGVDTGEIIAQRHIDITQYDTCATIYGRVAETNREMLLELLENLCQGRRPGFPQTLTDEAPLPRRQRADGEIDWAASAQSIYDLIRAVTRPYPGAFADVGGNRYRIWQAAVVPGFSVSNIAPGTWLGPVYSSVDTACGQLVACGDGTILLLELESEAGEIFTGHSLSDLDLSEGRLRNVA